MEVDSYAQGMSEFEEKDYDSINRLTKFEYDLFKDSLGEKILEVGAGWGRMTEHVYKHKHPRQLVAIEPSIDLYRKLCRRLGSKPDLELMNCEVNALQKEHEGAFDSVFSVHVLEHVKDDRQFIIDSLNLLKPGGRLIVLVPALQFLYSDLDRNIGHFRRYDKNMVQQLIANLPVRTEKLFYSNFLGVLASLYFLKFKKLNYQNEEKKGKFVFLFKIYDRYFIPFVGLLEKVIPAPIGLNLTFVLRKENLHTNA